MTEAKPQPATRTRKIIAGAARWIMGLSCLVCVGVLPAQTPFNATSTTPDPELEQHFLALPASARPWVFWEWLSIDTTREAITKDLEEMHAKDIQGVMLFQNGVGTAMKAGAKMVLRGKGYEAVSTKEFPNAHITKIPGKELEPWSPRSRELFRHVAKEADRLGMKFCLAVGMAGTSGPIAPEYGQQKLMWSETAVVGPKPACVEISRAACVGANDLEITVVNLWPNRMIGDAGLPEEKRFTETNLHKFSADTPLYPSGLLGPVEVLQAEASIKETHP